MVYGNGWGPDGKYRIAGILCITGSIEHFHQALGRGCGGDNPIITALVGDGTVNIIPRTPVIRRIIYINRVYMTFMGPVNPVHVLLHEYLPAIGVVYGNRRGPDGKHPIGDILSSAVRINHFHQALGRRGSGDNPIIIAQVGDGTVNQIPCTPVIRRIIQFHIIHRAIGGPHDPGHVFLHQYCTGKGVRKGQ